MISNYVAIWLVWTIVIAQTICCGWECTYDRYTVIGRGGHWEGGHDCMYFIHYLQNMPKTIIITYLFVVVWPYRTHQRYPLGPPDGGSYIVHWNKDSLSFLMHVLCSYSRMLISHWSTMHILRFHSFHTDNYFWPLLDAMISAVCDDVVVIWFVCRSSDEKHDQYLLHVQCNREKKLLTFEHGCMYVHHSILSLRT